MKKGSTAQELNTNMYTEKDELQFKNTPENCTNSSDWYNHNKTTPSKMPRISVSLMCWEWFLT